MKSVTMTASIIAVVILCFLYCSMGIQACNSANSNPNRTYIVVLSTGEVIKWVLPKKYSTGDTVQLYRNDQAIFGTIKGYGTVN